LSGEYRWKAGQFVDMALFMDAGKVTADRSDLNFKDLEPAYGVGVRFHAPSATVLRIDVAKTREGIGLVFTAGNIF
jgi:outer membrane translocation and assembly module TamA